MSDKKKPERRDSWGSYQPREQILEIMEEKNGVARTVLLAIMALNKEEFMSRVYELDDMNIRGIQIEFAYLKICRGDLDLFLSYLGDRGRRGELFYNLNKEALSRGTWTHEAIHHGARDSIERAHLRKLERGISFINGLGEVVVGL